jgi:hypothetical protein
MHEVIRRLTREIEAVDKPANRIDHQRFFKEKLDHPVALKTPVLRGVSNRVFKTVRSSGKQEILDICEEMLASSRRYMRFVAFEWAGKLESDYERRDFARFERWLKCYVDNWGAVQEPVAPARLCGGLDRAR